MAQHPENKRRRPVLIANFCERRAESGKARLPGHNSTGTQKARKAADTEAKADPSTDLPGSTSRRPGSPFLVRAERGRVRDHNRRGMARLLDGQYHAKHVRRAQHAVPLRRNCCAGRRAPTGCRRAGGRRASKCSSAGSARYCRAWPHRPGARPDPNPATARGRSSRSGWTSFFR
jgi:hypothetical protein